MKYLIAVALFISTNACASWLYSWEGQCSGPQAFGCSTVDATFTVPDAYHPGTSFSCFAFEKCIEDIDMVWRINYPDKPSITTIMAPESWFFFNASGSFPTGPNSGSMHMCWNSCGDVGIQIGVNNWSLMDGYRFVSGAESRWGRPERVPEPDIWALLLIGFVGMADRIARRK
jgi:hypothetical protein